MGAAVEKPITESTGIKNTYSPKSTVIVKWEGCNISINSHLARAEVISVEGRHREINICHYVSTVKEGVCVCEYDLNGASLIIYWMSYREAAQCWTVFI